MQTRILIRLLLIGLLVILPTVYFLLGIGDYVSVDTLHPAGYSLKGSIKGVSGQKIVLSVMLSDPPAFKGIDSVIMKGEEFVLEGSVEEPVLGILSVHKADGSVRDIGSSFWIENGSIGVHSDFTSKKPPVFSNAVLEEVSRKYSFFWQPGREWRRIEREIMDCKKRRNCVVSEVQMEARKRAHEAEVARIRKVVRQNSSSFYMLYGINQSRYLYTPNELSNLISMLDYNVNLYPTGRRLMRYIEFRRKVKVGEILPRAMAVNADGQNFPEDFSHAKITIIDFWASWCAPCREEHPDLKRLYAAYHGKGLEIIGVSIDDHPEYWRKLVYDNQLIWPNYIDTKKDSKSFRNVFCLDYIPQKIAVDNNGRILALNAGIGELEALVRGICGD